MGWRSSIPGTDDYEDVTSRHNVAGLAGESGSVIDETYKVFTIPGGTNPLTGGNGFVCSSCHDPHAGGKTPDGSGYISGNPRLLRTSLLGQTVNTVNFKMQTVDPFVYGGLSSDVFRVIEYKQGSTAWCGACHDRFKTTNHEGAPNPGEGHANFYLGMWRHPMDGHVVPPPDFDGSIGTGTPVEKPGSVKHVACFTCHRAHSTTAVATGWASSWPRDDGGSSNTSALLRMDNRGVCYNCHGAEEYNCWTDDRLVAAGGGGYIKMDCSKCHPSTTHFSGGGYACSVCHG
ncbi:hypothetical protein [Phosphitispora sp. TUW77]|uniref:hypothetical protein n=1 Tax=Phosphitispora sp. TUW77 TaxID=3152361 RepID=UPI003AB6213F